MKKFILLIVSVFVLFAVSACGSGSKEEKISLDQMIKAYQDAGIDVNSEEKPMYQAIQAKDGVMFKIDNQKVAIYEYESEKAAKKAKEENSDIMKDWPQKGTLVIESKNDQALQIFNSVK